MLVAERIKVKWSQELRDLCHASKDIYNRANYLIRQNYFYAYDEMDYQFPNYSSAFPRNRTSQSQAILVEVR